MSQNSTQKIPTPKPNYFLSSFSMTLVLFLLGLFALFSWYTANLLDSFKESINVIVELKDSVTKEETDAVVDFLNKVPSIKKTSIDHITKEEALQIMKKEMGDDFLMDEMANPLNEVITFNVFSGSFTKVYLDSLKSIVSAAHPAVTSVSYQETFVDKLSGLIERFGWVIIGLSALFLFVAITVMHNTIKLALYANRFQIKNMELVGASGPFIRRPFIIRAMLIGLVSGLLALGLLVLLIFGINYYSLYEVIPYDVEKLGILGLGLVLLGMFISIVSTYFIVNKYIHARQDDLF